MGSRSGNLREAWRPLAAGVALGVGMLTGANAQDAGTIEQGLAAWKRAGCSACHGTFAEGGGGGEMPAGPNLRRSTLEPDLLLETIACGRPGTAMPYHLQGAYTEIPCYGLDLGPPPQGTQRSTALSMDEVEHLTGYLVEAVIGKGAVSLEECGRYYGDPGNPNCRQYNR